MESRNYSEFLSKNLLEDYGNGIKKLVSSNKTNAENW
jgi:hypothetical protein